MAGDRGLARVGTVIAETLYRGFRVVMRAAIALHFRRVVVVGRERFPRSGAVLLAANHPSTWSDVLLLETLLGRRLHFLAEIRQFRPRARAVLLRIFGTLPVYAADSGFSAERNEVTFRRCRTLFDRGEAVAIFPEGISRTDRTLMPLKRGVARLALSYGRQALPWRPFALVPIALRYSDRTAFRSDVVLSVGEAIALGEWTASHPREDHSEVDRLTGRIDGALHSLGAMAEDLDGEAVLATLEPIAAARRRDDEPDPAAVVLHSISALRREDPEGYARLRRLARSHQRALRALGVSDNALRKQAPRTAWSSGIQLATSASMALPALVGMLIHAIPVLLARFAIGQFHYAPSQVAFARISAGFFFLTSAYALLAWFLVGVGGKSLLAAGAALAASAILGVIALAFGDRIRPAVERWRVSWIARRHPGLVARARGSEEALSRWVAERRRDEGNVS